MRPMPALTRSKLGSLDVLTGDQPGLARAALCFRVGFVDETPRHRGWAHLVEHLAFGQIAPADFVDGAVSKLTTSFIVEGDDEEVAERLRAIASRLRSLPLERLDVERRVLEVEAETSGVKAEQALLLHHFGYTGPGRTAMKELGLSDVDPGELQQFADRWFCAENAVVALSRSLSTPLDLPLVAGERRRVGAARLLRRAAGAVEVPTEGASVALGCVLVKSPAATVLAALLERQAWEVLRHQMGVAYDARCSLASIGATERLLVLNCDARPDDAGRAARAMLGLLDELDVSSERLSAAVDDVLRRRDRDAFLSVAAAAAVELVRDEPVDLESHERELHHVTAADVRAQAGNAGWSTSCLAPMP